MHYSHTPSSPVSPRAGHRLCSFQIVLSPRKAPPEASCMVSQGLGVIWLCLCSTSIIPPSASLFMSFPGSACPACCVLQRLSALATGLALPRPSAEVGAQR